MRCAASPTIDVLMVLAAVDVGAGGVDAPAMRAGRRRATRPRRDGPRPSRRSRPAWEPSGNGGRSASGTSRTATSWRPSNCTTRAASSRPSTVVTRGLVLPRDHVRVGHDEIAARPRTRCRRDGVRTRRRRLAPPARRPRVDERAGIARRVVGRRRSASSRRSGYGASPTMRPRMRAARGGAGANCSTQRDHAGIARAARAGQPGVDRSAGTSSQRRARTPSAPSTPPVQRSSRDASDGERELGAERLARDQAGGVADQREPDRAAPRPRGAGPRGCCRRATRAMRGMSRSPMMTPIDRPSHESARITNPTRNPMNPPMATVARTDDVEQVHGTGVIRRASRSERVPR